MIQKDWWSHAAVTMRLVYCHKKLHWNNCWWINPKETIAYWNVNHSCYEGWPIATCGGFSIAMSSPRTSSSQRLVSRQHQYQSSTEPCTTIIITIMLCSVLFIFSLVHFSYFCFTLCQLKQESQWFQHRYKYWKIIDVRDKSISRSSVIFFSLKLSICKIFNIMHWFLPSKI